MLRIFGSENYQMKLIRAFLRLVRWPNLVFIILTQALFYYCIILPYFAYHNSVPAISKSIFIMIVAASVLIAAAGYIINDYFDINIDLINKPGKLVVDKIINRRWAILWHFIFSLAGAVITAEYVYKQYDNYSLAVLILNVLCIGALWLYSTTFKKKLLIGNVLISLLTAWTILILYLANCTSWLYAKGPVDSIRAYEIANTKVFKLAILYASFAFIISLVREVIKDMEDIEGDERHGCRTMPIAWGIPAAKVFTAVWLIVLIAVLIIVQVYVIRFGWWLSVLYCILLIIVPLIYILYKLKLAKTQSDYHKLSNLVKLVMFTGILSMVFFKIYS